MNPAATFLTAFSQTLSAMTLYEEGHPARERVIERAWERLHELQDLGEDRLRFTFLDEEVVFQERPVREMRGWAWSRRLASIGVQRLETSGRVSLEDFQVFMDEVLGRMLGPGRVSGETRTMRPSTIRFGSVGIKGDEGEGEGAERTLQTATLSYNLRAEADTIDWLHEEIRDRDKLHLLEAESIVRSMTVAMHGDQRFVLPLLRMKSFDQYTTTHALNVSVLAMALAEFMGLEPKQVRNFGISGLLHDLGKVRIPSEILNKPGRLTEEERRIINTHPAEGARIIMESEDDLDLPAVVAYEHHIRIDGGGYPDLRYPRRCHQASDLVHVCDVFDALRTRRPYREAWEMERVLGLIEEGAGTEFDRGLARAFVSMMRTWDARVTELEDPDDDLRLGGGSSATEDASAGGPEDASSGRPAASESRPESGEGPGDSEEGGPVPPGDLSEPPDGPAEDAVEWE